MKPLIFMFLLFLDFSAYAQKTSGDFIESTLNENNFANCNNVINQFPKTDFTSIWLSKFQKDNLGFIGENYQRLRIHFQEIKKVFPDKQKYSVIGKSYVKSICNFKGDIIINDIRINRNPTYLLDSVKSNIKGRGILLGNYLFLENERQSNSGKFEGKFVSFFIIGPDNRILYDTLEMSYSDGFSNNLFLGVWKSYSTNSIKQCNWGEFRIPLSGVLDIGAGEFGPNPKYYEYGWRSYGENMEKGNYEKLREKWW